VHCKLNITVLFQASHEDARDFSKNGGIDLNLNLGLKDPDGDTEEQQARNNPQTENRFKRKSVTPDLDMKCNSLHSFLNFSTCLLAYNVTLETLSLY
jgi:hypothetical protein